MPRHAPKSSSIMDSSPLPQKLRRLSSDFSPRPSLSVLSWDGSEPGLELDTSPGPLLPQSLAAFKPCPKVDGYFPVVRFPGFYLLPFSNQSASHSKLVWNFLYLAGHNRFFPLVLSTPQVPSCSFLHHVTLYHCPLCYWGHPQDRNFRCL